MSKGRSSISVILWAKVGPPCRKILDLPLIKITNHKKISAVFLV